VTALRVRRRERPEARRAREAAGPRTPAWARRGAVARGAHNQKSIGAWAATVPPYDIVNDAQHEDDASPQTNGVMSLGLVRFLLQATIDVSTSLGLDADERAVWQGRLTNLSPYPTFTMNGNTVFRYTQIGRDWNPGNSIGIQHIYSGS
jgi:hypothetical protein